MKKDDTSDFTFFPACLARKTTTPTPRPLIATVAVRKNALITHGNQTHHAPCVQSAASRTEDSSKRPP